MFHVDIKQTSYRKVGIIIIINININNMHC